MWARNFDVCVDCSTTDFKHMAKGLCSSCYARKYRNDPSNAERLVTQKRDWYVMNHDLSEMKRKRDKNWFDGKREKALKKDNYTCCKCGSKDRSDLLVHHKDGSSNRSGGNANNSMKNLITLCRACHIIIHRNELQKAKAMKDANRWSRKYNKCLECDTTDRKHAGRGLCINCYARFFNKQKLMI